MPVPPVRRVYSTDKKAPGLAVTEGTFLDFAPEGRVLPVSELAARTSDPWLLGLLVRESEAKKKALQKIQRLRDPRARTRALSGMFLGGARTEARKYLTQVALPRNQDNLQDPDFKVLGPWLLDGFDRVPQVPERDEDLRTSRVRYLLPAAKAWLRTRSAGEAQAAYYDVMLGKPETLLLPVAQEGPSGEGYPPPTQGPFERGDFAYADVLRALAPGFYRAIHDAESHILGYPGYYRNVPVLEVRQQGEKRYLGILDPQTGDMLACRDTRGHGPVAFGSRADLLIYAPSGIAEEEEGRILRLRWLARDPAGVIMLLKQSGLGAGLGYLARAAQERAGGFTWREWDEFVRRTAKGHADGFAALRVGEVLAVSPGLETADALRALLPDIARAVGYVDAGRQGLAVVAAYLALREHARAEALLDELPGVITQSRETYDGQGDIGWENRCGIEAFRILSLSLAGAKAPRPSEELKQYWGSVREQFEEVTRAVERSERERWMRTLLRSGVSGE
jgi:hypothetical protein